MSTDIKQWHERTTDLSDQGCMAGMKAEIAELREALAASEENANRWSETAAVNRRAALALAQAPSAPVDVCDECHGSGVQHAGYSGQDSDGNAPISEPCSECGYGDSAPVAPETPVAALMYMDELPAAQAGEAWIAQFAKESSKVMYSPDEESRAIRVKWCAYFDSYDRLVAAYLLTRDMKNWTQLSRVRGEPFAPRADLSVRAGPAAIPEGWQIERLSEGAIRVELPGDARAIVRERDHATNVAAYVLYGLASDLIAAPTPPTTGEA